MRASHSAELLIYRWSGGEQDCIFTVFHFREKQYIFFMFCSNLCEWALSFAFISSSSFMSASMACPKASFVCAENHFPTKWPPNIPSRAPTRPPTIGTGMKIWPTIVPAILPPVRKSANITLSTTSVMNSFLVLINTPLLHFLYS